MLAKMMGHSVEVAREFYNVLSTKDESELAVNKLQRFDFDKKLKNLHATMKIELPEFLSRNSKSVHVW